MQEEADFQELHAVIKKAFLCRIGSKKAFFGHTRIIDCMEKGESALK
jgi:hypothetical protein